MFIEALFIIDKNKSIPNVHQLMIREESISINRILFNHE